MDGAGGGGRWRGRRHALASEGCPGAGHPARAAEPGARTPGGAAQGAERSARGRAAPPGSPGALAERRPQVVPRAVFHVLLAGVLLLQISPAWQIAPAWSQEPGRARSLPAAVVKIVSGDTIHVFVNGDVERVRYIGAAEPEPRDGA